jgi:acetylglutamate kinase
MTDVPGVLHNKDDPKSLYRALNIRQCRTLIEEGIIAGGMIPKVWRVAIDQELLSDGERD